MVQQKKEGEIFDIIHIRYTANIIYIIFNTTLTW